MRGEIFKVVGCHRASVRIRLFSIFSRFLGGRGLSVAVLMQHILVRYALHHPVATANSIGDC